VIDEETGKPIPNALVIFNEGAAVVLADSSGQFEVRMAPKEVVHLQVGSPGYKPSWISIRLRPGEQLKLPIELGPRGHQLTRFDDRNAVMQPSSPVRALVSYSNTRCLEGEGVLAGTVFDRETGRPVPFVNIFLRGTTRGTSTDSMGRFQLGVPANRKHVLVFSHIGYAKEWYDVETGDQKRMDLQVELDPRELSMKEVTVVGSQPAYDPSSSYVVGEDDIERMAPINFEDLLLRRVPQLRSARRLSVYQNSPDFVLYVDGISWDPQFLNHVDLFAVHQVTIWSGANAPIYYGAGSARYVVDVRTR
jgi:hypothetical protein